MTHFDATVRGLEYDELEARLAQEPEPERWGQGTEIRNDAASEPPKPRHRLTLPPSVDLDAFLDADEPDFDWLLAGLIERGDRVMWTGPEGGGKSTLLRQFAVQLGSGIHPFTLDPVDPLAVLVVDCENSARQTRRALRPLRAAAGDLYVPGSVRVITVGGAIAVASPEVEDELAAVIVEHEVDLVIIGPLYKMGTGDPVKEEPARALADTLDRLRLLRGSGLLIEAHTPYAEGSRSSRPKRPYGASLWSRWPEYGIYLDPGGALTHWRGQREERAWPDALTRAEPWPWAAAAAARLVEEWDGPTHCMDAVLAYFESEPGTEVGINQAVDLLKARDHAFRKATVTEALNRLALAGQLTERPGPNRSRLFRLRPQPEEAPDELF